MTTSFWGNIMRTLYIDASMGAAGDMITAALLELVPNEKSTLKKDLQAWRGKMFTDEELQGFNLLNILNKPCQLQIILEEKNGKQYNNIAGIMSLPKGTAIEQLPNTYHFDIEDESTYMNWRNIPSWIQERIKKADNYVESNLEKFVLEYENNVKEVNVGNELETADDLPF